MDVKRLQTLRTLSAVLACAIAGCTGGGALPNSAAPTDPAASARVKKPVLAKFVIHIPRKRTGVRAPRYISPATKSISITVDPGAKQTVLDANVTLGSPGCTTSTCTFLLDLAPGTHVFNIATYDATLSGGMPHGNVLSQTLGYPFTIVRGNANAIGVVLQGVPASIVVAAAADQDVQGNQQSGFRLYGVYKADGSTLYPRSFTVAALDADGNIIAGAGAPTLTMTSSKSSTLSNGAASSANPNLFTVAPLANDEVPIRFTIVAGSISTSVIMQIVTENAPRVFVTDQTTNAPAGKLWAFDELGNPLPGIQNNIDAAGSLGEPAGISQCPGEDRFYIANEASKSIMAFHDNGTYVSQAGVTGIPLSVACDGNGGSVYAFLSEAPAVTYSDVFFPSTVSVTGNWNEISTAQPPQLPWTAFSDTSYIWIADAGAASLIGYDRTGTARVQYELLTEPFGIADVTGFSSGGGTSLIFSARDANQMWFPTGSSGLPGYPGLKSPFGIRQDPANGYLYVVQAGADTVTRYDANGDEIALPAGAFSGPQTPLGIEIDP